MFCSLKCCSVSTESRYACPPVPVVFPKLWSSEQNHFFTLILTSSLVRHDSNAFCPGVCSSKPGEALVPKCA